MQNLINIKLPAKIENLEKWIKPISECAKIQGFDQKRISEIELALEEALVNIFTYAYPEKEGRLKFNVRWTIII